MVRFQAGRCTTPPAVRADSTTPGNDGRGQALPGTTPPLLHSPQFHDFCTTPLQLLPQQLVNYGGRLVGVVNGNYLVLVQPLVDFIQVFILKVFDDGHAHFG